MRIRLHKLGLIRLPRAVLCAATAAALLTGCAPMAIGTGPGLLSMASSRSRDPAPLPPSRLVPTATPDAGQRTPPHPWGPTATPTAAPGEPFVIGTSVAGRPLVVYRFGTGPRELFIAAGIHGGYEWNTTALADLLIEHLSAEPEIVPPGVSLYLLRAINPDGDARSHSYTGRANDHGVDLNRNWPTNWHLDWKRTGCWDYLPITAGPHPVSEPEVQAVMRFILDHDFRALISYHSAALGVFPGGSPPDPSSQSLAEAIAEVSGYLYPPRDYGCEYTGQFADWATTQGIAAVDVELSTHDSTDYEINLKVLDAFLNWRP
jgi:predicted deacylase